MLERDGAYHQGTVWPWLLGPFVEAWVRVRGGTAEAKAEARARFLEPLLRHLDEAGLGHVSEIADGDAPHNPGGCPVPGLVGGRGHSPRPGRPRERRSFLGHVPKRGDQQAQAARGRGPAPFGALSRAWA